MQERPARHDVPEDLTWDLADIYPGKGDWEADLERVEENLAKVKAYEGRLGEGAETILDCLEAKDALRERLGKVYGYAYLHVAADGGSPENGAMMARAGAAQARIEAGLASIEAELLNLDLDGLMAAPPLRPYRRQLEKLRARRAHMLSADAERALSALGQTPELSFRLHQAVTSVDMQPIRARSARGEEVEVSMIRWSFTLATSPDRALRRSAYHALTGALDHYKATLMTNLAAFVKKQVGLASLRGYDSAIHMVLERDHELPEEVYEMVLDETLERLAPSFRRLMALKGRALGIDDMKVYDAGAPLAAAEPRLDFKTGIRLVTETLKPFGGDYGQIIAAALAGRWIDRADNVGKWDVGISVNVRGVHPYASMHWQDSLGSVSLLIHELGHAVHGVLASRAQRIGDIDPSYFFVEVPSTLNQCLLVRHLLRTSRDAKLRLAAINRALDDIRLFVVHCLMDGRLERHLYRRAEAGEPLSLDAVANFSEEEHRRFFGGGVEVDERAYLLSLAWPHMVYVPLSISTYAPNLIWAHSLAELFENEGQAAIDRWLEVLRAGGAEPPVELMKIAGVDVTTAEPIRRFASYVEGLVDELEAACKDWPMTRPRK